MVDNKEDLWIHTLRSTENDGLIAEFGVWTGKSVDFLAAFLPDRTVFGFDSFQGLQEDWAGYVLTKGSFDLKGVLPKVRNNVNLIQGWFDETLPTFLRQHHEPIAFMHIDCDTFQAAKTVLELLNPSIVKGTVILFDEYFGYHGWQLHEFKAFQEFVQGNRITYEYLGFSVASVSVRISHRD